MFVCVCSLNKEFFFLRKKSLKYLKKYKVFLATKTNKDSNLMTFFTPYPKVAMLVVIVMVVEGFLLGMGWKRSRSCSKDDNNKRVRTYHMYGNMYVCMYVPVCVHLEFTNIPGPCMEIYDANPNEIIGFLLVL